MHLPIEANLWPLRWAFNRKIGCAIFIQFQPKTRFTHVKQIVGMHSAFISNWMSASVNGLEKKCGHYGANCVQQMCRMHPKNRFKCNASALWTEYEWKWFSKNGIFTRIASIYNKCYLTRVEWAIAVVRAMHICILWQPMKLRISGKWIQRRQYITYWMCTRTWANHECGKWDFNGTLFRRFSFQAKRTHTHTRKKLITFCAQCIHSVDCFLFVDFNRCLIVNQLLSSLDFVVIFHGF